MTKDRIHFDQNAFEKEKQNMEQAKEAFQNLLDAIRKVGAVKINKFEQLKKIANEGSEGFKEVLSEEIEPPKFAGIPLKKRQTVDLMELPDLSDIDQYANEARNFDLADRYLTLNGNAVKIDNKALHQLEERNSLYAETSKEQNLYNAHQEAIKAIEKLQKASDKAGHPLFMEPEPGRGQRHFLTDFFLYKDGKIELNPSVYREIKRENA